MTIIVEGFDKRDWNGYLTTENAEHFGLVGIKVSQGRRWYPRDRAVLQRQWARANSIYGLLRLPFHYLLSPWPGQNYELYGRDQAKNFHQTMIDKNNSDFGELPPCIDVEHRFVGMAGGDARAKNLFYCLKKTEDLWGKVPLIYTATWYWDKYMHQYFVKLVPDYWKKYDLWEADPPPDTTIAGWGDRNAVQQVVLDQPYPGFAGGVDINETTRAWLNSKTQTVPIPIPSDCDEEVKKALTKQECEHLVDLEVTKKAAYNLAVGDAGKAVDNLAKI